MHDVPIIVEIEVEIEDAPVGFGFIGFDGAYVGKEVVGTPGAGRQTLAVCAEQGVQIDYLVARNIDPNGTTARARITSLRAFSARLLPGYLFVLYQPEKTSSQTMEASIAASDEDAMVERHHFLAPKTFERFDKLFSHDDRDDTEMGSYRKQLALGREAAELIESYESSATWILTGIRDPLDRAISAFFQHLPFLCPDLTFAPERVEAESHHIIDVFTAEFDAYMRRRSQRISATELRPFLLDRTMQNLDDWMHEELESVFGVNVSSIRLRTKPFVRFNHRKRTFVIYRSSELRSSLPSILKLLPLAGRRVVVNRNQATEKPYSAVYEETRQAFVPTPAMFDYYYGGSRFFIESFGAPTPKYGASTGKRPERATLKREAPSRAPR